MKGRTDQSVFARSRHMKAGGHYAPRRWSLARVVAAAGMVGSVLFTAVSVSSTSASAATFGNGFMDIAGNIQYDGTGAVGWGNSGTVTSTGCTNGGQNVVETPTAHGLFNCGATPTAFPDTAALPTYNSALGAANGVFAHAFVPNIQGVPVTGCNGGTGGYSTGGKFNDNLSADGYDLGGAPDAKDQIGNIYAVARANPTSGSDEVYVGVERFVNNGDSHIAFEFLQEPVAMTNPCGGTNFVAGDRVQGDVALEIDFTNGGTAATPTVLVWSCDGKLPLPSVGGTCGSSPATWAQEPACGGSVTTNCYNPDAVTVTSNTAAIPCGGWACESGTTVPTNEFGEGAINLDQLGINAGCASSFIVISKSSQSPTADIHGVAPPVSFDTCTGTHTVTTPTNSSITLGDSNTDKAVVTADAGAKAPTGSVTFYECGPLSSAAGCDPTSGSATKIGTVTTPTSTSGLSTTYTSPSFTPPSVGGGTYCFAAVFAPASGSKLEGSQDGSSTECFTVNPIKPGFTTNPASPSITFGGSNTDSATVAGNTAGGVPGGSVSFSLCKETTVGNPCTGGSSVATASPTAGTPSGDSRTFNSVSAKPTSTGTWCFNASYSAGTGSNYTDVSAETNAADECFTVNPADTKTDTTISNSNITFGPSGTVTDNVTVTGNSGGPAPSGTVDFYFCQTGTNATTLQAGPCAVSPTNLEDSKAPLGPSPTDSSSSIGTSTTATPTAPGTWCFGAVYSGDGNYNSSQDNTTVSNTDSAECVLVAKAPSQTTTTVQGASGAVTNASVGDKATVTGFTGGPTPGGSVTFTLFSSASALSSASPCDSQQGASSFSITGNPQTVGLSGGSATAAALGPLPAGHYGYEAVYGGDSNYSGSTGNCEPFTVGPATTNTATTLVGTAGAKTNASVSDQATVTTTATGPFAPTGTVTFTLYTDASALGSGSPCAGQSGASVASVSGNPESGVTLSGGAASSSSFGPLAAGNYGFEAVYTSGDGNFTGSTGNCEPFTVGPASTLTTTEIFGAAGAKTGSSVSDQATVTTAATGPFVPTGTVTFTLYSTGSTAFSSSSACTDQSPRTVVNVTGNPDSGVLLTAGQANSSSFGPLPAGNYGFEAVYTSGDSNFTGSTGNCEPFTVAAAPTQTSTTVMDNATGKPWSGTETTGAEAFDTAAVTPQGGGSFPFPPTGTVTFKLYTSSSALSSDGSCTGTAGTPQTVTINPDGTAQSSPTAPLATGFYGYQASYTSGDGNYSNSIGNCEPFAVGKPPTVTNTTVLSGDQQPAPASSQDSATVTLQGGGSFPLPPTGTVTFTLYSGGSAFSSGATCTSQNGTPVGTPQSVKIASDGTATSSTVTGLTAGFYGWQAVFSNDPNYAGSTGNCEPFHVLVPPTVSASKAEPTPGDGVTVNPFDPSLNVISYKITLVNTGQIDATGVTLTDPIPTGTTVATIGNGGSSNGTSITWSNLTVPAGGTTSVTFSVDVSNTDTNGETITNQASFTVPSGDLTSCGELTCETNTVSNPVAFPIIAATKAGVPSDPQTVNPFDPSNNTVVYTITLTNTGDLSATVPVTDSVPAGTTFASATNNGQLVGSEVEWTGSNAVTVPADGTASVSFTVTVNTTDTNGQVIPNTAVYNVPVGSTPAPGTCTSQPASTPESGQDCNTNTVQVTVAFPILSATKSSTPVDGSTVKPGDEISYQIKVTNSGDANATVNLTDAVPNDTTFVSGGACPAGATCSFPSAGAAAGTSISWSGVLVSADSSTTVSFTVVVVSTAQNGDKIPNFAIYTVPTGSVSPPGGCINPNPTNGTCDTNTVQQIVEFPIVSAIKKSVPTDGSIVKPGDTIVYTIQLTNSGLQDATGVTVTDKVPAGTTFVSADNGGTESGGSVTWSDITVPKGTLNQNGSVTPGAPADVSFTVTVNADDTNGEVIPNVAAYTDVNNPNCDGAATCNTNTVTETVEFPILTAVKSSVPGDGATVKRGDQIVYTITLTNSGLQDATDVTVTDTVPAGTTFVSADNGGVQSGGTVTWSGLTVPAGTLNQDGTTVTPGAPVSVSFTVKVNADDTSGQVIDNVALFTDVHTPNCNGAPSCDTNHVKQTVLVPTPATVPAVSTTTTTLKHALAFTGADLLRTVEIAFGVLAGGALLLIASRRRRRSS